MIDTELLKVCVKQKNSKADLLVHIRSTKCIISHREQINTQVALFEDIFKPRMRTGIHFLTSRSLVVLVFDTVSKRLNHVEQRSSCCCSLTFIDLVFVSSRNMKGGNENFYR